MANAKEELIEHIGDREVEYVYIARVGGQSYRGAIEDILGSLDFNYDSGYGSQELFGYIWYVDGSWSERLEYDGSESWGHKERPTLDVTIEIDTY